MSFNLGQVSQLKPGYGNVTFDTINANKEIQANKGINVSGGIAKLNAGLQLTNNETSLLETQNWSTKVFTLAFSAAWWTTSKNFTVKLSKWDNFVTMTIVGTTYLSDNGTAGTITATLPSARWYPYSFSGSTEYTLFPIPVFQVASNLAGSIRIGSDGSITIYSNINGSNITPGVAGVAVGLNSTISITWLAGVNS